MRLIYHSLFLLLASGVLAGCTRAALPQNTLTPPPSATTAAVVVEELPLETAGPEPICNSPSERPAYAHPPPIFGYELINSYPHDPNAFTQGLIFVEGKLYESTGIKNTGTSLRRVDLETGQVEQIVTQPSPFFGEGLAMWEDRLIQLTWREQVAFIYDRVTLDLLGEFSYSTQGWGLAENGRCLIMSDGTDIITFRDPLTFAILGELPVYSDLGPLMMINELEFINGEIYANIWMTDMIARIAPETGQVTAWIDLSGLADFPNQNVDVLNGIAYDAENDRLFVTGKNWPALFEIKLVEAK